MLQKFQELVLRSVRQKGPDCRANDVQEDLTLLLKKEQSFGAVFTTLDRLKAKGFVDFRKGEPDNRRGGRAPRLYWITGEGIRALNAASEVNYGLHVVDAGGVDGINVPARGK